MESGIVRALLAVTLLTQALLILALVVTRLRPQWRIFPPPARRSWQFYFTWVGSWIHLSGAFLLMVFDWNSLEVSAWVRFGLGAPLVVLGQGIIFWGFRALSVHTTLGLGGPLVRSGPYRYSRNPQYVGACTYLLGLALLSGSGWTLLACLGGVLWYLLIPWGEEPWLRAQFGADYETYCKLVPRFVGWRPAG